MKIHDPATEVTLSRVLAKTKACDLVIVEPARKEDYKAKWILKLID